MVEVREITFKLLICARSVMSSSVMPSAKYCCAVSLDKSSSGNTARELMGWVCAGAGPINFSRIPPRSSSNARPAVTKTATAIPAAILPFLRTGAVGTGETVGGVEAGGAEDGGATGTDREDSVRG